MNKTPYSFAAGGLSTADVNAIISALMGVANGLATLDSGGKLPASQLTLDAMEYKGAWNASTNTPTLIDGTGDTGDFYRVSVAASRNLGSGAVAWQVGDAVIYSGSVWQKVPVFVPTASDIANTPAGNIAAVTVQTALNELDTEKVAKAGDTMTGMLTINGTGSAFPTVALAPQNLAMMTSGVAQRVVQVSYAGTVGYIGWRVNGTPASPTAIVLNDFIYNNFGCGYDGSTFVNSATGFRTRATQNWSVGACGAKVILFVCPNGSVTATNMWEADEDGSFHPSTLAKQGLGTLNCTALYVQDNLAIDTNRVIRNRVFTVGTLPAGVQGMETFVSDALAPAFGAAVAGGGAVTVPVYYSGAAWNVG